MLAEWVESFGDFQMEFESSEVMAPDDIGRCKRSYHRHFPKHKEMIPATVQNSDKARPR